MIILELRVQAWTLATEFLRPRDLNDPTPRKQYGLLNRHVTVSLLSLNQT